MWSCLLEKDKAVRCSKIQTNMIGNKVTIVMENVGYLAKHWKSSILRKF